MAFLAQYGRENFQEKNKILSLLSPKTPTYSFICDIIKIKFLEEVIYNPLFGTTSFYFAYCTLFINHMDFLKHTKALQTHLLCRVGCPSFLHVVSWFPSSPSVPIYTLPWLCNFGLTAECYLCICWVSS